MKPETEKLKKYINEGRKLCVYDVETTGLNKVTDAIIEYSAIVMEKGEDGKYHMTDSIEQYIRPKFKMDPAAIAVHGITDEFLEDYPYEEEAFSVITTFLDKHKDAVIAGYNQHNFDDAMMYNLALRQGRMIPEHPEEEIDVFTVVKENIFEKNRKLATMHALLCPGKTAKYHDSSDDIRATWDVAEALYEKVMSEPEKALEKIERIMRYRSWTPGGGHKYVFVTCVIGGKFAECYYDTYYKTWKSKEVDIGEIDTDDLEQKLRSKTGMDISKL